MFPSVKCHSTFYMMEYAGLTFHFFSYIVTYMDLTKRIKETID